MDGLPDELIFHILNCLNAVDIICVQRTSKRYLALARDTTLWKTICFGTSRAESTRRRIQALDAFTGGLDELRSALVDIARDDTRDLKQALGWEGRVNSRNLAFANWDPTYPGEVIDFYQDYVDRHAPVSVGWLSVPSSSQPQSDRIQEVTGTALYNSSADHLHAVSALDDGSVVIHDLHAQSSSSEIAGHSGPGLLTPSTVKPGLRHALMTESGATDSISINTQNNRTYFAVEGSLQEVDLSTLSLVSSRKYPFSITALSAYSEKKPLFVGTNQTVHIYDPREPGGKRTTSQHARVELISGPRTAAKSHITLSQPGPLSILHPPDNSDSIWITGRFTSLLQYSVRSFPRLVSTVHSGSRISCLTTIPYPFVPATQPRPGIDERLYFSQRMKDRAAPGWTAICAGEYKGKGSLELFDMSEGQPSYTGRSYLNRQTASRSKLLAVATHGARLVHADGDGNLKWVERDGSSLVRSHNINDSISQPSTVLTEHGGQTRSRGLFDGDEEGDIVQKILPFSTASLLSRLVSQKLLLWTGEGRLGVLSFGPSKALQNEEWHDAVEAQFETTAEKARHDAETQYSLAMRRALERNADEVRFVRGLGLASSA